MCECRYYGRCAGNCDSRGLVLGFGNETYDCDYFSQLPDVDALLALADEMDASKWAKLLADMMLNITHCIREACGEMVE